jgi:hypothetical protein
MRQLNGNQGGRARPEDKVSSAPPPPSGPSYPFGPTKPF